MTILPLHASTASDAARTGAKGANLLELMRLGLPVPGGVILTTAAYEARTDRSGLRQHLQPLLESGDWEGVEQTAHDILTTSFDEDLASQLAKRYREMGQPPVAVRSSATSEDLAEASFAGQYETFLNVQGEAALVEAIGKCWASLWNRRVMSYMQRRRADPWSVRMAVIIQEMVPAEVAGVVFTVDPVQAESADMMRIEAARGLGEAVVSGVTAVEVVRARRDDPRRITWPGGGHLLTENQVVDLCALALRVEDHFGPPQDIEFAVSGGAVFLLQARPITTLAEVAPEPLDPPGKPSIIDRIIKPFVDERYAVAPRPLDNLVFIQLVGGHIHVIRECGSKVAPEDLAAFEAQIWRQAYRLPRIRRLARGLLGGLAHQFRMLQGNWMSWWENGPRQSVLAACQPMDVAALSDQALLDRAQTIVAAWRGPLLTRLSAASGIRAEPFLKFLVTLAVGFGQREAAMACLMTGTDNPTLELNDALWKLSRLACQSPLVKAAVRAMDCKSLENTVEGREFLESFEAFLRDYGHREGSCWYLTTPTWRQDPSQVWRLLGSLVETDKRAGNPEEVRARRVATRKRIEGRLRFAPGLRWAFCWMLDRLTAMNNFREHTHFDLTRPLLALQQVAAEWGRRLAERGLLRKESDVGYLTVDEVRQWLTGQPPSAEEARELVARRRSTYRIVNARWQEERFAAKPSGKGLRGVGASSGVAQGPVRIIRGEHEFDRLRPGDVLVSPYTTPAWTPLFTTAAAVVTETGGVSSHAAIVAREYGVPAVMAASGATRLLRDGERILVDGSRGLIRREGGKAH